MLLGLIIFCQLLLYGFITYLSRWFEYSSLAVERPLLWVLAALFACFVLHLWGLKVLLKMPETKRTFWIVVCAALAFRGTVLPSLPIQEVDIYRYIWDGAVVRAGVSPFAYSPERVLTADKSEEYGDELQRLVDLRDQDDGLHQVLRRVHYAELTTIYPPVSQVVFCAADKATPKNSTLRMRVLVMKIVIVAFDVGIIIFISKLLSILKMHQAWLIPYAWSPLIMKEFANSGHLDSIAVFFAVLGVYVATRVRADNGGWHSTMVAGLWLGLGVGAKLYPVVLLPVLVSAELARKRWMAAASLGGMTILVSAISLSQMIWDVRHPPADQVASQTSLSSDLPPLPDETVDNSSSVDLDEPLVQRSEDGLSTFLSRWEMNDLIFMIIEENIRENLGGEGLDDHWFVIVPKSWRSQINSSIISITGMPPYRVPFVTTRVLTLLLFFIVVLALAYSVWRRSEDELAVLQAAFLTVAWFWLLAPTQNPWYWSWALPLVVFARGRAWLAVGGLCLMYYLRFWLLYHYPESRIGGTDLTGTQYFDFVLVWFEFAPFLVMLFALWCVRPRTDPVLFR